MRKRLLPAETSREAGLFQRQIPYAGCHIRPCSSLSCLPLIAAPGPACEAAGVARGVTRALTSWLLWVTAAPRPQRRGGGCQAEAGERAAAVGPDTSSDVNSTRWIFGCCLLLLPHHPLASVSPGPFALRFIVRIFFEKAK